MPEDRQATLDHSLLRRRLETIVRQVCPAWLASQRDDIVQAAWLRLDDILKKNEGRGDFPASYIWKAAYSVTVEEIRRVRRRREEALDGPGPDGLDSLRGADALDPERRLAAAEIARAIRACLAGIIPPRRRALGLYLLGHGVQECSRVLQEDYKRMENLILRGLADLRACLASKGVTC